MRRDRDCGMPYPMYPMGMPMPYYQTTNQNNINNIDQQINNIEQEINNLERRISNLENMYSNKYSTSNYQMM